MFIWGYFMNIMFQNILAQGGIHCICVLYAFSNLFQRFLLSNFSLSLQGVFNSCFRHGSFTTLNNQHFSSQQELSYIAGGSCSTWHVPIDPGTSWALRAFLSDFCITIESPFVPGNHFIPGGSRYILDPGHFLFCNHVPVFVVGDA